MVFSEPVDPVDALAPANYELREAGADGVFGTDDDVVYALAPAYSPGSTRVVLDVVVPGGGLLPEGTFRFRVSGSTSIHDLSGLRLDGDGDGIEGGDDVAANQTPVLAAIGDQSVQSTQTLAFTASAVDSDGHDLTFSLDAGAPAGAAIEAGGVFSWTPTALQSGAEYFITVRVTDSGNPALSDAQTVRIAVSTAPSNIAPVATADNIETAEDTPLTFDPLENDSDADGSLLTVHLTNGPAHGSVVVLADGQVTYTPNANYFGADSFTYRINDGELDSNVASVSITVTSVNDAPATSPVILAAIAEDSGARLIAQVELLTHATDVDGPTLAATGLAIVSGGGALADNGDGTWNYTPAANDDASVSFGYNVTDGTASVAGSATLDITPVNDAPVAEDKTVSTDEDAPLNGQLVATDVDNGLLGFTLEVGPTHGTLAVSTDGRFTYTPGHDFNGTDSFSYVANDGTLDSNPGTVSITIISVNDRPVARTDTYDTDEDTVLTIVGPGVLANDTDADGDALRAVLIDPAPHGSVSLNDDGSFTYTPHANFSGTDGFTYRVSDGLLTDTGLVTITIDPVNDAPVLAAIGTRNVNEGTTLLFDAAATDADVPANGLTFSLDAGAPAGAVIDPNTGVFSWTPTEVDGPGLHSITVRVTDNGIPALDDFETIAITVNVSAENAAPVFEEIADQSVEEGHILRFTVSATDVDDPAGALTFSAAGLPSGATFDPVTHEFLWVPADDTVATVTFLVADPDGATGTMDVVLTATNDAPTVNAGADQVVGLQKRNDDDRDHKDAKGDGRDRDGRGHGDDDGHKHRRDGEAEVSIAAVFNDLGTRDTHTATIDWGDGTLPTTGTVAETPFGPPGSTTGADGTVTGSHTYKAAGLYTITVTVVDDNGGVHSDTLQVTVKKPAENKHFKARPDEYRLAEDNVLQIDAAHGVLDNDRGPAGSTLQARLVEGPDHGSLVFNADGSFTYTPDANFNGKDWFWYEFTDGVNVSQAVKVELEVKPVYDPPMAPRCIDWHARTGDGWGMYHSPHAGSHHGHGGSPNFSEFLLNPHSDRGAPHASHSGGDQPGTARQNGGMPSNHRQGLD